MASGTSSSKKIMLFAIFLVPLAIAFLFPLYPQHGINTDLMWRFNMMIAKGYSQFLIALLIYLVIVYLAFRIYRSLR